MKAYTGSVYVNDFNMFNRVYKVYMQAEAPYRMQKENLNMFFVKTSKGNMVPLTALGKAGKYHGPRIDQAIQHVHDRHHQRRSRTGSQLQERP